MKTLHLKSRLKSTRIRRVTLHRDVKDEDEEDMAEPIVRQNQLCYQRISDLPDMIPVMRLTKVGRMYNWDYRRGDYPSYARGLNHTDDRSLATYKGHSIKRTLTRCYFSPAYRKKMEFHVGDWVEVCSTEDGFIGSYLLTKLVSNHSNDTFQVHYQNLVADDEI